MNHNHTKPVDIKSVHITGSFWARLQELARTEVIPYQWKALNDQVEGAAPSYCIKNLRIAAGLEEGKHGGFVFQDSDLAKWIEAVGFSLMIHPDAELEKTADETIDLICAAQQPDGYMNSYYIINGLEKRFTDLMNNHELYCLGHFIEGAVAYYNATGKDKLLKAMCRYVDLVDTLIGPEEGKLHGYPGHEVIEMALVKLYDITKDEKHLRLAKYFIDERGKAPLFFKEEHERDGRRCHWENSHFKYQYYQAGLPVREQKEAQGHSVRAAYLYSGMADVARKTNDETLWEACKTLWDNLTEKRMYVTGAIGSSHYGEAFTYDYDLPNDTIYGETCASIGLVFFAQRMLEMEANGRYADVMEKALYNGTISGMSLDGKSFFYVNPLEVIPEASEKESNHYHVKVQRQKWFGCACCPPNLARLLTSLGGYLYSTGENSAEPIFYQHLYAASDAEILLGGKKIGFHVKTNYPWDETVETTLSIPDGSADFTYALRIPGWCHGYSIAVNGKAVSPEIKDGYALLTGPFGDGDKITLVLSMPVELIAANPQVRADIGKVAVTRGPIVYCLEQEDNGTDLHRIYLSGDVTFETKWEPELLDGIVTLTCPGAVLEQKGWDKNNLYRRYVPAVYKPQTLRWIPYYSWANRSAGEMSVWVRIK